MLCQFGPVRHYDQASLNRLSGHRVLFATATQGFHTSLRLDTFTPQTTALLDTQKVAFTRTIDRELPHYPVQDRHFH
jgi:hypothetical protein